MKWLLSEHGLLSVMKNVFLITIQRNTYRDYKEMAVAPLAYWVAVYKLMKLKGWK